MANEAGGLPGIDTEVLKLITKRPLPDKSCSVKVAKSRQDRLSRKQLVTEISVALLVESSNDRDL
jgi:hypothetical protein